MSIYMEMQDGEDFPKVSDLILVGSSMYWYYWITDFSKMIQMVLT